MYKAILLIPDVFNHKHTKLLANLLLERLGFGSAILHQVCKCNVLQEVCQSFLVPPFNRCVCLNECVNNRFSTGPDIGFSETISKTLVPLLTRFKIITYTCYKIMLTITRTKFVKCILIQIPVQLVNIAVLFL